MYEHMKIDAYNWSSLFTVKFNLENIKITDIIYFIGRLALLVVSSQGKYNKQIILHLAA